MISAPYCLLQDCEGGGIFSYVHCCFDLQEFQLDAAKNVSEVEESGEAMYKAGHSHLKTGLASLMDTPWPNNRFIETSLKVRLAIGGVYEVCFILIQAFVQPLIALVKGDSGGFTAGIDLKRSLGR